MMQRIDRRSFLASGLKVGAAGAGAALDTSFPGSGPVRDVAVSRMPHSAPGAPSSLTANGSTAPVGVDPDDLWFAWHVTDRRRGAVQSRYRIVVAGPEPSKRTVWDSGRVDSGRQAFVAYRGPPLSADARYRWTVRTADAAGTWGRASAPATFTTGLRSADWSALWLRPGPADPGEEQYTYLRSTHSLPRGSIAFATAYVAAAHKYQLWINGAKLDTGPSFCFPDEQYYQATDVTRAVRAGRRNAVGILHHWYGPGQGRPASVPGLLVQVTVHYDGGKVVTVVSDAGWRSRRAEWLPAPQRNNDGGDFVEWIDARSAPNGWSRAAFDDRSWEPTEVRGPVGSEPFTGLFAQRTRITEEERAPTSVRGLRNGSIVVDFGKVYAGRPTVAFRHGVSGHVVPMHVGYTLDPDGSVSTTHNTQATDLSFSYTQRAGSQTFDPYGYLGFRYLQIDDPGEHLGRDQVAIVIRHATMPGRPAATFTSSSAVLDEVFRVCAHSGLYTSQEQFVDTPTREKGQFVWDATNESQTVMRAFGEQNLSWQGLRDMARAQARYWPVTGQVNEVYPNDNGPQSYPSFTALYPEWVWRYYLSTGDLATVVGLLPTLTRLADYLIRAIDASTGLLSGLAVPTNGDNQYGYDTDTTADTTVNVLAVNAFRRIGDIAVLSGDSSTASMLAQRAAALRAAVNARLVGPAGRYVDGLRSGGVQSPVSSQQANVAALAYGVVPSAGRAAVAKYVASLDISVEPDHGMELLRALHAGGRDADVVRILTDTSFPGWAAILEAGGTFTWETWTPSDLIGDSMSHGWGSSALVAIQESLLGVVPDPPAAGDPPTMVSVTPPSGGLAHASGTLSTPSGELSVAWHELAPDRHLSITVPPNAAARCTFPGAQVSRMTEAGRPVGHAPGVEVVSATAEDVVLAVGAGAYDFRARH